MLKGYRTLILNLLAAVAPVLQATSAVDLGLTGNAAIIYGLILALANVGLRVFTSTPIGKSE